MDVQTALLNLKEHQDEMLMSKKAMAFFDFLSERQDELLKKAKNAKLNDSERLKALNDLAFLDEIINFLGE